MEQCVSLVSFSLTGGLLASTIAGRLEAMGLTVDVRTIAKYAVELGCRPVEPDLKAWCARRWQKDDMIVFVGASGIAVRTIAPCVHSKVTDPAVLVIDEGGNYVISLLSGHLGGANAWASCIAELIHATPVITTATDVHNKFAVDVWAKYNQLIIDDMKMAKEVSAAVLRGETVYVYCPRERVCGDIPQGLELLNEDELNHRIFRGEQGICLYIDPHCLPAETGAMRLLHLIPRSIVLGIGCRRDQEFDIIRRKALDAMDLERLDLRAVEKICSIDLKKMERGICTLAQELDIPFVTYTSEELGRVPGEFTPSRFVAGITGVDNVCERSAVLGSGCGDLIIRKLAGSGVTIAAAVNGWRIRF